MWLTLCYSLHQACEGLKDKYSYVNEFVSCIKKTFKNAPARIKKCVEITGLRLTPSPVVTRWGILLKTAVFICNHFQAMCGLLDAFSKDSWPVKKRQWLSR